MKKALLIIFTVVVLVVFFTACSVTENESETVSTTAITDKNGMGILHSHTAFYLY